jgi:ABC-type polysaccharide/polyol phosphate export permease
LLGYWGTKDESLVNGVTFGFVLSFVFMIAGYSGQPSLLSRIPIFLVLSAFGGICGIVVAMIGHYVRRKLMPKKSKREKST